MPNGTLLVNLNDIARLDYVAASAAQLAAKLKAHAIGLYVIPAVQIYPSLGFEAVPQVFEGHRVYFKQNEEKVRARFEAAIKGSKCDCTWRVAEGRTSLIADEVLHHGRACDFIMVSAPGGEETSGVENDFIESVAMAAGRPIIVLPAKGTAPIALDDVMICWNSAAEAARAVFDAIPLLKAAKTVRIVWAGPPASKTSPGSDIAEALSRHGIKAETQVIPAPGNDHGAALLGHARETNAGLIVMGAYGHSRLAELVFGGATRHVIANADRAVLFSH
jgi:nucleotide-binding universal stress UspA family protein